jgi:hypothetical protein
MMRISTLSPDSPDRNCMRSESLESAADEDSGIPYSRLKIRRSIDSAPSSALSPAGIAGLLKVVMCMNGMVTSVARLDASNQGPGSARARATGPNGEITRNLDQRYCILLDGIFTFLPPSVSSTNVSGVGAAAGAVPASAPKVKDISDAVTKTRAVGSMENRSISLSGYVIRKLDDKKISIKGSKGESTSYTLEASSPQDCQRWLAVLSAHVEHVDNKAGSKWIF